jgi:hypothetical protein
MTHTVRTILGTAPVSGSQAVTMTSRFKAQLCSVLKKPEAVTLLTVEDVDTHSRGVVAMYDSEDEGAVEWVKRASVLAPAIWEKLAERRRGRE